MSERVPQCSYSLNLSFNENTTNKNNTTESSLQYMKINGDNTIQTNSASPLTLINTAVPEALQQVLTHYGVAAKKLDKRHLSNYNLSTCNLPDGASFTGNDITFSNFQKIQENSILNSTSYANVQPEHKKNLALKIDSNGKVKYPAPNKLKKKRTHRRDFVAEDNELVLENLGKNCSGDLTCEKIIIKENVIIKKAETKRKHDNFDKNNYSVEHAVESKFGKVESSCGESYSEAACNSDRFSNNRNNYRHSGIRESDDSIKKKILEKERNIKFLANIDVPVLVSRDQNKSHVLIKEKNNTSDSLTDYRKNKEHDRKKVTSNICVKDISERYSNVNDQHILSQSRGKNWKNIEHDSSVKSYSVLKPCNELVKILKSGKVDKKLIRTNENLEHIKKVPCFDGNNKIAVSSINYIEPEKQAHITKNYGNTSPKEQNSSANNELFIKAPIRVPDDREDDQMTQNNEEIREGDSKLGNQRTEERLTKKCIEGKQRKPIKNQDGSAVHEDNSEMNIDEAQADEKSSKKIKYKSKEKQKITNDIIEDSDNFLLCENVQSDIQSIPEYIKDRKKKGKNIERKQINSKGTEEKKPGIKIFSNIEIIQPYADTKDSNDKMALNIGKTSKNERSETMKSERATELEQNTIDKNVQTSYDEEKNKNRGVKLKYKHENIGEYKRNLEKDGPEQIVDGLNLREMIRNEKEKLNEIGDCVLPTRTENFNMNIPEQMNENVDELTTMSKKTCEKINFEHSHRNKSSTLPKTSNFRKAEVPRREEKLQFGKGEEDNDKLIGTNKKLRDIENAPSSERDNEIAKRTIHYIYDENQADTIKKYEKNSSEAKIENSSINNKLVIKLPIQVVDVEEDEPVTQNYEKFRKRDLKLSNVKSEEWQTQKCNQGTKKEPMKNQEGLAVHKDNSDMNKDEAQADEKCSKKKKHKSKEKQKITNNIIEGLDDNFFTCEMVQNDMQSKPEYIDDRKKKRGIIESNQENETGIKTASNIEFIQPDADTKDLNDKMALNIGKTSKNERSETMKLETVTNDKMELNISKTSKNDRTELGYIINLAAETMKAEKSTELEQISIDDNGQTSHDEKKNENRDFKSQYKHKNIRESKRNLKNDIPEQVVNGLNSSKVKLIGNEIEEPNEIEPIITENFNLNIPEQMNENLGELTIACKEFSEQINFEQHSHRNIGSTLPKTSNVWKAEIPRRQEQLQFDKGEEDDEKLVGTNKTLRYIEKANTTKKYENNSPKAKTDNSCVNNELVNKLPIRVFDAEEDEQMTKNHEEIRGIHSKPSSNKTEQWQTQKCNEGETREPMKTQKTSAVNRDNSDMNMHKKTSEKTKHKSKEKEKNTNSIIEGSDNNFLSCEMVQSDMLCKSEYIDDRKKKEKNIEGKQKKSKETEEKKPGINENAKILCNIEILHADVDTKDLDNKKKLNINETGRNEYSEVGDIINTPSKTMKSKKSTKIEQSTIVENGQNSYDGRKNENKDLKSKFKHENIRDSKNNLKKSILKKLFNRINLSEDKLIEKETLDYIGDCVSPKITENYIMNNPGSMNEELETKELGEQTNAEQHLHRNKGNISPKKSNVEKDEITRREETLQLQRGFNSNIGYMNEIENEGVTSTELVNNKTGKEISKKKKYQKERIEQSESYSEFGGGVSSVAKVVKKQRKSRNKLIEIILKNKMSIIQSPELENKSRKSTSSISVSSFPDQQNLTEDILFARKRKKHKKLFDVGDDHSQLLNDTAEIVTANEDQLINISILSRTKSTKKIKKIYESLDETENYSEFVSLNHQDQNNKLSYSNGLKREDNDDENRKRITQPNEKENSEDIVESLMKRQSLLVERKKRKVTCDNSKIQKGNLSGQNGDHHFPNAGDILQNKPQNKDEQKVKDEKKSKTEKKKREKVEQNVNQMIQSENETKYPHKRKTKKSKVQLDDHISNILSAKLKTFFENLEDAKVDLNEERKNEAIFKESESSGVSNISINYNHTKGEHNENIDEDIEFESPEENLEEEYRIMQSYIKNSFDSPTEDFVEQLQKKNDRVESMLSEEKPLLSPRLVAEQNENIIKDDDDMDLSTQENSESESRQIYPHMCFIEETEPDLETTHLHPCEKLREKVPHSKINSPLCTRNSSRENVDELSCIDDEQISTCTPSRGDFLNSNQNLNDVNETFNEDKNIRSDVVYLIDDMELESDNVLGELESRDGKRETMVFSPEINNMHKKETDSFLHHSQNNSHSLFTSRSIISNNIKNISNSDKSEHGGIEKTDILKNKTSTEYALCENDEIIEIPTTFEIFIPNENRSISEIDIMDSEQHIEELNNKLNMDKKKDTQSYIDTFIQQSKLGTVIAEVENPQTDGVNSTIGESPKESKNPSHLCTKTVRKRTRRSVVNGGSPKENCVENPTKKMRILRSKTEKTQKKSRISNNTRSRTGSRSILDFFKKENDERDSSKSELESDIQIEEIMTKINDIVDETSSLEVGRNSEKNYKCGGSNNFEQQWDSNTNQEKKSYSFADILSQSHTKRMKKEFDDICNESSRLPVYDYVTSESCESSSNHSSDIDDAVETPTRTETRRREILSNKDVFKGNPRKNLAIKLRTHTAKRRYPNKKELKERERRKEAIRVIKQSKSISEIKKKLDIPRTCDLRRKIKKLCIENPFPLSAIQKIAPSIIVHPTEEQKRILKDEGIELKSGFFSEEEDNKIMENWKKFCEHHDWDETDYLPFMSERSRHGVLPKTQLEFFVQFISHGFENRTMTNVFNRFRRIISSKVQNSGRFTAEEDEIIMEYLKNIKTTKPFVDIATILNRPPDAVWRRHRLLIMKKKLKLTTIRWNKELAEKFLTALVEETCTISLSELKNRKISFQEWSQVGKRMKLPADSLKRSWFLNFYPRFFAPDYMKNMGHNRRKLFDIVSAKYSRWGEINWGAVSNEMGDGFPKSKCSRLFRDLVRYRVPESIRNNLKETLKFLSGKDLSQKKDHFRFLKEIMEETKNGTILPNLKSRESSEKNIVDACDQ